MFTKLLFRQTLHLLGLKGFMGVIRTTSVIYLSENLVKNDFIYTQVLKIGMSSLTDKDTTNVTSTEEGTCPITMIRYSLLVDPVMGPDGRIYEKAAIMAWIARTGESPLTRQPMRETDLKPVYGLGAGSNKRKRTTILYKMAIVIDSSGSMSAEVTVASGPDGKKGESRALPARPSTSYS